MVIIPTIEYRAQLTVLTQNECSKITSIFRRIFKNKLNLSITAPNAIMENRYIYNFRDLYEVLKQSQISNFYNQLNDRGLLHTVTYIRLNKIQQLEGLSRSPLVDWPYTAIPKKQLTSFTTAMITFCRQHGFSFDINRNVDNLILGGNNTIRKAIPEPTYAQARNQLNNHSFLYIEQLTSLDGSYLLNWRDISRRYNAKTFKTPKWFIELSSTVLENTYTRLVKPQYCVKTNVIKGKFF